MFRRLPPKLNNGMYPQKELDKWAQAVVSDMLLASIVLNSALLITVIVLSDKLDKEKSTK